MPRVFVVTQTFLVPADGPEYVEKIVAETHRRSVESVGGVEVLAHRKLAEAPEPDVRMALRAVDPSA